MLIGSLWSAAFPSGTCVKYKVAGRGPEGKFNCIAHAVVLGEAGVVSALSLPLSGWCPVGIF